MAQTFPGIDDRMAEFIRWQHVFFVATAPLSAEGHINLSPKGLESFAILDPRTVAYLDLMGSGIETVAHARENGRIVIMFCAFEGPPKIVRLHGRAETVERGDADFDRLVALFPPHEGVRSVIRVALERITDTCGYGVPLYQYQGQRTQLTRWVRSKGPEGLAAFQREYNAHSIDGLPGLNVSGDG
ncbi:MAG: pyridoxamine 5'-phosphate oxidase family protein [Dehalococcoidia bacterium]